MAKLICSPAINKVANELLLAHQFLEISENVAEGKLIRCITPLWESIYAQLSQNPKLIYQFSQQPEAFEQFIAAAYDQAGFSVTLTPRSGDGGKDIIAEKPGLLAFRVLDQCKAFSENHRVNQNDVRAMLGVLGGYQNASKAVITTTSTFAPGVQTDPLIQQYVPYRLELRDGPEMLEWLKSINGDHP